MHPLLGTWPATQVGALTGRQTSNPLVCNPLIHTSQGSLSFLNCHTTGVGLAHSESLPFWSVLSWLLYVLIYKIFVQLVFRWFSMMLVLWFNCNFGVVLGRGEHSIYLFHHLDCKSQSLVFCCGQYPLIIVFNGFTFPLHFPNIDMEVKVI